MSENYNVILNTIFDNYEYYNSFIENYLPKRKCLSVERDEILNEVILQLSQFQRKIEGASSIDAIIKSTIKNIFYNELSISKGINGDGSNKSINRDVGLTMSESIGGKSFAVDKCNRCGSSNITYWSRSGVLKCNSCNTRVSFSQCTHINKTTLPFSRIFKMVKIWCSDMRKPYMKVYESVGVSSRTAYKYKRLIISAIKEFHSVDPIFIFSKIATIKINAPIKIQKLRKDLLQEEIWKILEMKKEGYTHNAISLKFKRDVKCIEDIIYGRSYKNIERFIPEKVNPAEFTEEQVFDMLYQRQDGKSIAAIAKMYNTYYNMVHKILYGESHLHIERPILEKSK